MSDVRGRSVVQAEVTGNRDLAGVRFCLGESVVRGELNTVRERVLDARLQGIELVRPLGADPVRDRGPLRQHIQNLAGCPGPDRRPVQIQPGR